MIYSPSPKYKLILASKSPRRQELLKQLGWSFEIKTKEVEENFPLHLTKEQVALYLAELKAKAFEEELNDNTVVITADTIVCIDNLILGKPTDYDDAVRILNILSGKKHEVITAVCLRSKEKQKSFFISSYVYFKKLTDEEINYYITNYKPFDKAGSYGVQDCLPAEVNFCSYDEMEFLKRMDKINLWKIIRHQDTQAGIGFVLIEKIDGSYFNVMGLPVKELYEELQKF